MKSTSELADEIVDWLSCKQSGIRPSTLILLTERIIAALDAERHRPHIEPVSEPLTVKKVHEMLAQSAKSANDLNETLKSVFPGYPATMPLSQPAPQAVSAWPSEEEIKNVAKHEDSDGYFGFLSGVRWIKERMGAL